MITAGESKIVGEREGEDRSDEILNQLVLNMKALMLLDESRETIGELVEENLVNSHDEQIRQFLELTQKRKKRGSVRGYFLVACGELILASLLILAGLATVFPSVIGLTSPQELVDLIGQFTSTISVQTLSNPLVPALDLLLALLLLLGAFQAVRLAALNLGEMGLLPNRRAELSRGVDNQRIDE